MNYVYNITVNLKKDYLDFFEWNKTDHTKCLHKLPIMKVSDKTIYDFMYADIRLKQEIKSGIYLLFCDNQAIVVKLDNDQIVAKSSLVVDEELDILENNDNFDVTSISYDINKINYPKTKTRLECEECSYVHEELKQLRVPKDNQMINYLYLECFGYVENDSQKALISLKQNLKNKVCINKISEIIKLINQK